MKLVKICLVSLLLAGVASAIPLNSSARSCIPADLLQLISVDYRALKDSPTAMALKEQLMPENIKQFEEALKEIGLDPEKVTQGLIELRSNNRTRERLKESTNIFRVLIKTLLKSGLITERTRAFYATYVDMDELKAEGDRMVGDDIAEEGIKYLQAINFKERSNAAASRLAAE
jgi:hypothetical protein